MEDAFLLWDDLLKTLTLHQRSFLCLLTNEMSILIAQPSRLDITIDSYREAVYTWLINILTAEAWAASRKRHNFDPSCVISTCLMNPNHWSRRLAMALAVETDDHLIRAQWGDLVKRSNAQYECSQQDVSKNERVSDIKKDVDRVSMEIVKFEEQAKSASQGGGWVKWQGPWVPKPIGLI